MAGSHISLRVDDRELKDFTVHLHELLQDPSLMFLEIGEELLISHRDRLNRGVGPDGKPFAPLSPAYKARKPRNKDRVLIRDSYLINSLNYQLVDGGLDFGTPMIYGATHQFGDEERGIPQREYLGLSAEDGEMIQEVAIEHLKRL